MRKGFKVNRVHIKIKDRYGGIRNLLSRSLVTTVILCKEAIDLFQPKTDCSLSFSGM